METDNPVLNLDKMNKSFGGLPVPVDPAMTVGQEEIAGLIGPKGAGKEVVYYERQCFSIMNILSER
jgi:ABC-type branched-subunit amino acid transport system ATPase component